MRKRCYQSILKEKQIDWFNTFQDVDISPNNAIIKQIDYDTAKKIIVQYEWLGTMPAGAFFHTGLYFGGHLAAVEVFTETKAAGFYTLFGEPCTLLARGCCVYWAPNYSSTLLISKSLKLLEKHYAGKPRYILAYSDWEAGEIGTVYQASNWIYLGHKNRAEWRSPDNGRYDIGRHRDIARLRDDNFKTKKLVDTRIVAKIKQKMLDSGWTISKTMRGSYATTIGYKSPEKKRLIEKLEQHKQPYPKNHD